MHVNFLFNSKLLLISIVCLLLGLQSNLFSQGQDPFVDIAKRLNVAGLHIPTATNDPDLTKIPDFKTWQKISSMAFLNGSVDKPPLETEVYITQRSAHLYFAIRCFEPNLKQLNLDTVPKDGNVWKTDNVELFLLPGLDSNKTYYHFVLNPAGSIFDAKLIDKNWNSTATTFAFKDSQSWIVILKTPLKDFGFDAQSAPILWRANFHRYRPKKGVIGKLDLAWSPTKSKSNHVPTRFGLLSFENNNKRVKWKEHNEFLNKAKMLEVLLRQTFTKETSPFIGGKITTGIGPGGKKSFLRIQGERSIVLKRNFGDIRGLQLAAAYRCNSTQKGVVVHGQGTVVRACRPGKVTVLGRGLKVAKQTCNSADGFARAYDLGLDSFKFVRPYGHCQQGNMPPTPTSEWAVLKFEIDNMYSNDHHKRVIDMKQQYKEFRFTLNDKIEPTSFLELGWVIVWRGNDTEKPTTPNSVKFLKWDNKNILIWQSSSDNLLVSHYEVVRKEKEKWVTITTSTMCSIEVAKNAWKPGQYAVIAVDVAGNSSVVSETALIK
ncbi:MAG: hypothetical protein COA79_07375 [Planctomycetota bacterium]|nr:MAG: hypothetical protein COA79_07375 [Planctomycetota bacterium]